MSGISQKAIMLASSFWAFIIFAFGLSGAWLVWFRKETLSRLMIAMALMAPLAVIPIIVETRYRMPVYPFLAIFAGYFAAVCLSRWRTARWNGLLPFTKIIGLVSLLLILNSTFDIIRNWEMIAGRLGF
jgi:hypothetical protein